MRLRRCAIRGENLRNGTTDSTDATDKKWSCFLLPSTFLVRHSILPKISAFTAQQKQKSWL